MENISTKERRTTLLMAIALSLAILTMIVSVSILVHHFVKAQTFEYGNRDKDIAIQLHDQKNIIHGKAVLLIYSDSSWSGSIMDTSGDSATQQGLGDRRIEFSCHSFGTYSLAFQMDGYGGYMRLVLLQDGKQMNHKATYADFGMVTLSGSCD